MVENFRGRKLSRISGFLWGYAKVFSAKFGAWRPLALQKRGNAQKFSP